MRLSGESRVRIWQSRASEVSQESGREMVGTEITNVLTKRLVSGS